YDAGVVHEDVEAPERALRLVEEPQDIRLDGDVARDGMGLPARALDVAAKRLRGGGIAQVIDADGVAARGGEPRGGRADAAATARDQHDLVHSASPHEEPVEVGQRELVPRRPAVIAASRA